MDVHNQRLIRVLLYVVLVFMLVFVLGSVAWLLLQTLGSSGTKTGAAAVVLF